MSSLNDNDEYSDMQPQRTPPKRKIPIYVIVIWIVAAITVAAACTVFLLIYKPWINTGYEDFDSSNLSTISAVSDSNQSEFENTSSESSFSSESSSSKSEVVDPTITSSQSSSSTEMSSSESLAPEELPAVSEAMTLLGANMVYVGETFVYSFSISESVENDADISWECVGNSGTITQNGEFTALEKGEVTLIVRDAANDLSAKLFVHIVNSTEDVDFVPMVNNIPLVNKTYPLPSDYAPGGLTAETSTAFERLVEAAAADGLSIYMISGYRSYEKQQRTYLGWCNKYGTYEADRVSARAGFSEHQLGMAIDVNSLYQSFANTAEGLWLAEHCWEYGFIIRYPKGKEGCTGYSYEPWHIRYLGDVELAKSIMDSGLCLEEYLGIDSKYRD